MSRIYYATDRSHSECPDCGCRPKIVPGDICLDGELSDDERWAYRTKHLWVAQCRNSYWRRWYTDLKGPDWEYRDYDYSEEEAGRRSMIDEEYERMRLEEIRDIRDDLRTRSLLRHLAARDAAHEAQTRIKLHRRGQGGSNGQTH